MVHNAWSRAKTVPDWQQLFVHFDPDQSQAPDVPGPSSATPQKPKAHNTPPVTPPPPEQRNKRRAVAKAANTKSVPLAENENPPSPTLRRPQKRSKPNVLESDVPDLEEAYHQSLMMVSKGPDLPNVDDIKDEDVQCEDVGFVHKRRGHVRLWKSKPKSQREIDDRVLSRWLAMKGISYQTHSFHHRQGSALGLAKACELDGWKNFKSAILQGDVSKCSLCDKLLFEKGITLEDIAGVLEKGEEGLAAAGMNPADKGSDDGGKDDGEAGGDDEPDVLQQCIDYMKGIPSIELIVTPEKTLKYRCLVCLTRRQKNGKINKLGKPHLKTVKDFMTQHLQTPTHITKLAEYEKRQGKLADPSIACPGFLVSDPDGQTVLNWHQEEFRLWTTHQNCDSKNWAHDYSCSFSEGNWYVKHKKCPGQFQPTKGQKCCDNCFSLSSGKHVARRVARFALKYYGAQLLAKRLFHSDAKAKEFLEERAKSAFTKRHEQLWDKLVKSSNLELQAWLRNQWVFLPVEDKSQTAMDFIQMVVEPLLSVHPGSVSDSVKYLSQKFVDALSTSAVDVPWQHWDGFWVWDDDVGVKSKNQ